MKGNQGIAKITTNSTPLKKKNNKKSLHIVTFFISSLSFFFLFSFFFRRCLSIFLTSLHCKALQVTVKAPGNRVYLREKLTLARIKRSAREILAVTAPLHLTSIHCCLTFVTSIFSLLRHSHIYKASQDQFPSLSRRYQRGQFPLLHITFA